MTRLADADARARIAGDFATTLFVEAAAGTGKTTVLVSRIIGLVRSGRTNLQRIVAVTFTEKAAGEMKLRIRKEIEDERKTASLTEQQRLEQALAELELARIGTIHAFCGDILRERPVEAGIDPKFEVASDDEMRGLVDEAFERWFEAALADPPEGIRRLLRRPAKPNGPREQLRTALDQLIAHRDFPTAWRRDAFDREGAADRLLAELTSVAGLARQSAIMMDWSPGCASSGAVGAGIGSVGRAPPSAMSRAMRSWLSATKSGNDWISSWRRAAPISLRCCMKRCSPP
jgi:ATP-dependent helicase/nuclease subunit A